MARKELTVETVIVTFEDGKRIERNWDDIPEKEQEVLKSTITDRFMAAAGYHRADRDLARA